MKIIHLADVHLGASLQNLPNEQSKLRKREIIDSFFQVLDYGKEQGVQAIIIAGDFFDKNTIAYSLKKEIMDKITKVGIDVLYLRGNHDNKIEIEMDIKPSNLKMFDVDGDWTYFSYPNNVVIAGIDINKQSNQEFYDKLELEKKNFNIVVLHGSKDAIQLDNLKSKNIDFIALGDKHIPDIKEFKLDIRGKYGYSGCLDGRGFDDPVEHGFFVLEVDGTKYKRTFISVGKRKYETIAVSITGCENHSDIEENINKKLAKVDKNNILRIELTGKCKSIIQKDLIALEAKLKEVYFYVKLQDKSTLDLEELIDTNDISLRNEFLKIAKDSGIAEEKIDKIIEYGIKALTGEIIEI